VSRRRGAFGGLIVRDVAPRLCERAIFRTGGAFLPKAAAFLESVPNPRVEKPFESEALRAILRSVIR